MDIDTVSKIKCINKFNFLEKQNQTNLKKVISSTILRLEEGLKFSGYPEWFCMTEPDVLIRGKITYPANAKLLGSRVNYAWYKEDWIQSFIGINKLISKIDGSIPIVRWGSVPVIGNTKTLLKGINIYKENFSILDSLTQQFHAVSGFDLFLPLLFALAGEEEIFSSNYTECLRNKDWEKSPATVIHQFRKYYDEKDFYKWGSSGENAFQNFKQLLKTF